MSRPRPRRRTGVEVAATRAVLVVLDGDVEVGRWTLAELRRPDLSVVDDLARVQLDARRLGWRVRVEGACAQLRGLVELAGLEAIVPCDRPPDEALED